MKFCTPRIVLLLPLAIVSISRAALVGWWKMDEASGTVAADSSGLPVPGNGTVVNGGTFQPAAGKFGGCIYLDGTDDYITIADRAEHRFPVTQSFSVSLWYKSNGNESTVPTEYSNGLNQGLFSKAYPGTSYSPNYFQLQLTMPASGTTPACYFVFDSRISTAATTPFRQPGTARTPIVVDSQWHHLATVMNRSTKVFSMYIDGALYHSITTTAAAGGGEWDMGSTAPLIIGNHQNRYCRGWFDDVAIWNEALTPTQISTLFSSGVSGLSSSGDTDSDGLADSWETQYFGDLSQNGTGDPDSDGLTNAVELIAGTNPSQSDTDGDGLNDGLERNTLGSNPLLSDTDGDTLPDGAEVNLHGTDPTRRDTDGDNWYDNEEVTAGSSGTNPASRPAPAAGTVHINEFVSENVPKANGTWMPLDMDGDAGDWLELRNTGAASIDLIDWQLSDDETAPAKWRFPHLTVPAGGYVIVYASGKNKSFNGVQPHTNFKLGSRSTILLSRPDGIGGNTIVSQVGGSGPAQYPGQKQGFSYGRTDNTATGALAYLTAPTPGAANSAGAVTEFVSDTAFSVNGGLFSAPVTVTISCATPGCTIAYTKNGSEPTPTNGTQAPALDGASPASVTLNLTETTLIRARAWKTGLGSSNVDTQSYLYPASVLTQNAPTPSMGVGTAANTATTWGLTGTTPMSLAAFPGLTQWGINPAIAADANPDHQFRVEDLMALPTLSLVADWKDLFGPNAGEGIYPPASGVAQEGVDRAASLEFLNPAGSAVSPNALPGFRSDGNIHIFGGTSQGRWKSFKLSFRFQCLNDVNYKVYGDGAANSFSNFVLDAAMNNTWMHPTDATQRARSAFSRDYVMADLQNRMSGAGGFHTRACHLYLNGMYWGIYWLHEKPDHHFAADYFGGDSSDYDVFKHSMHPAFTESDPLVNALAQDPTQPVSKPGSTPLGNSTCATNFEAFLDLIGSGNQAPNPTPDLTQAANYNAVAQVLDIDHFIDYMILNFVAGNQDWSDKNLYCSRSRATGGKWRFSSWDAEHVFRTGTENFIAGGGNEVPRNGQPKDIHNKLRVNAEYKLRFADRIRKHMFHDGALTVAAMKAVFDSRHAEISDAIRAESARWGHARASLNGNVAYKRSDWLAETLRITLNETAGGPSVIQNRWNLYMAPGTGQFRLATYGLYPSTEAPSYSQHGGAVSPAYSLTISNPNASGTVYYTLDGSDPRTPGAPVYTSPVTLTSSGTVKSRILIGGVWSALTEAYFSVGTAPASAANLVISEFNYNPANPSPAEIAAGFSDANDFEYLELQNISSDAIVSLAGCTFTSGISFHCDNSTIRELAPGERLVIAENPAAFALRYGTTAATRLGGSFELNSNLSNGGETITLTGADGNVIKSFTYNDRNPWPEAADGAGYSLVLIHPERNPDHSLAGNWRPSSAVHGTPGGTDITGYSAWKTTRGITADYGDDDQDGFSNVTEYLLHTDPLSAASRPAITSSIQPVTTGVPPVTESYLFLSFARDPGADDVSYFPEFSTDLNSWSGTPAAVVRVSVTPNPDGTQTEVWRSAQPVSGAPRRYGRVRITSP